jgi:SAM-dependent methyltransferase
MTVVSPITKTVNVSHISTYEPCIMSDSRITERRIDNYLCLDTGLVFNGSGARGSEKNFYTDEYDLHSENDDSEFKFFEANQVIGIYDDIAGFIDGGASFRKAPSILDIGCGKGILLRKLRDKYPGACLHGVEPSKNALKFFQKVFPDVSLFEGIFEDSPFLCEKFDLVASNGVLEHVPDPVVFMKNIRSCIAENGFVYIGVPNFRNNPADLFTYDHLSRFTPETVKMVFELGGFEIVASKVSDQRVPMWFVLKPTVAVSIEDVKVNLEESTRLVGKSLQEIKAFFQSYEEAAVQALAKNKRVAVYGTGTLALIATRYTALKPAIISRIFDDNMSIWGSERLGIAVDDPKNIIDIGDISEVIISANPCYVGSIENKIKALLQDSPIVVHAPRFS